MSLGTFKFVDIRYRNARNQPDSAGYGHLNAAIRMTQVPTKSVRAEVLLVSKSNGFVGPGFQLQYRNRSALRGAEQLLVNVTGTFENQTNVETNTIGITSYEVGIDGQLLVPRLITPPFNIRLVNSDFQPRTSFGAGYRYVQRVQAFQQDVFNLNYGYSWKTKVTNEQELRPIDLQYIRLASQSAEFRNLLVERPFLANSFRQQFILGSSYRYTYNQQVLEQRRNQLYFSGGLEVSGNLAYLLSSLRGQPKNDNGAYALFGQEFSQYTKVDLELRNYFRTSANPNSGTGYELEVIAMVVIGGTALIGGRGTIWGPALGAALLVLAAELFRSAFAEANLLIYGLLILVVTLFMPRGLVGEAGRYLRRRRYAREQQ